MYECLSCLKRFHYKAVARAHLKKEHNIESFDTHLLKHHIDMVADLRKIKLQEQTKAASQKAISGKLTGGLV